MHRKSVLLPDPLGPIMQTTSPFLIDKFMSFKTLLLPKLLLTFFNSRRFCSNTHLFQFLLFVEVFGYIMKKQYHILDIYKD